MRRFGRFIVACLALVGVLTLAAIGAGIYALTKVGPSPLPARMVVLADLADGLTEGGGDNPLARLSGRPAIAIQDLVATLDRAQRDDKVSAIIMRFDGAQLGMAQAQEVRDAIAAFRQSGKRAVAYATAFGEGGGGTIPYYAASAFSEVWLQPSGEVGLTGFLLQSPFVKETLDMVGVKPEFAARWEYKSAIETFTQTQFSKEAKGSVQTLVDAWVRQVTDGIAKGRGLAPEQVRALIDKGPLLAQEAREGGLVDRLGYWDEVEESVTTGGAKLVTLADYAAKRVKPAAEATKIAIIRGVGPVQNRDSDDELFSEEAAFSAERVVKAFAAATKDGEVRAILFRIDSPGGSYTASDAIWRAVSNARAAGKPVVVSMGDMAASGGYFAAMAADSIVAQPGTITGSIGVFSGKLVLSDLWRKLGVNWDGVRSGKNAGIWSENESFSPEGWARLNTLLDHIYADFTAKAAQGRKLPPEAMDAVARGRIWAGDRAKELGLVDQVGGYATALGETRRVLKLAPAAPLQLVAYPEPKGLLGYMAGLAGEDKVGADIRGVLKVASAVARLAPWAELAEGRQAELMMPPLAVR